MVLLGYIKRQEKVPTKLNYRKPRYAERTYFVLLNWWKGKPLVLVSPEYLRAYFAEVHILRHPLGELSKGVARKAAVVAECGTPDYKVDLETKSFESWEVDCGVTKAQAGASS